MRIRNNLLVAFILMLSSNSLFAQIGGLWEVTSVQVGSETMTPTAKWTEFRDDGSYISGNGWLRNIDGNWEYDPASKMLSMIVVTGFEDEFGPFSVEMLNEHEIQWTREEEGAEVKVFSKRITEIPKHPATLAVGLWQVTQVFNADEEITDAFTSEEFQAVFVRWDNRLQEITMQGRKTGIWRVDAHRPVIDILYYDGSKPLQYWELDFENENSMSWMRDEIAITFERLTSIPE